MPTIFGTREDDTIVGTADDDSIYSSDGNDDIDGQEGNDRLYGGAGRDRLFGRVGNDYLDGGADFDFMEGGLGDDTYIVNLARDEIIEANDGGVDTVWVYTPVFTLAANVENANLYASGNVLYANIGDNVVVGNAGANLIYGYRGDDTLTGGDGDDNLQGGGGTDLLTGGVGDDRYFVTESTDQVVEETNAGTDVVVSGVDYVLADNLEHLILFGEADFAVGNDRDNGIYGNASLGDVLNGEDGTDEIFGRGGDDTLYSGAGVSDKLFGDAGNDTLVAQGGGTRLRGGTGSDQFVFESNIGYFRILDFSNEEQDRIDLSALDAIEGGGDDAFTYIGQSAFSGTAGELRFGTTYDASGNGYSALLGDTDGDGFEDFIILMRVEPEPIYMTL